MQLDDSVWLLGEQVVLIKVHEFFISIIIFQFDLLFSSFSCVSTSIYGTVCQALLLFSLRIFSFLLCYFIFRCSRNLGSIIVVRALVLHETQAPSKYMRVFMDISAFAHSNFLLKVVTFSYFLLK